MAKTILINLVLTTLAFAGTASGDNVYESLCAGHKVNAAIGQSPSGKTMLLVDGQPQPLFWASLTDGQDPSYRRAGFNTLLIELVYTAPEDPTGEKSNPLPASHFFATWDQQLLTAKQGGFFVVIYIHNSIHSNVSAEPMALDDTWQSYIQQIVERYRHITNLVGWTFSDEYGDAISFPNSAFQEFLKRKYSTLESLNRRWQTSYKEFEDVQLPYPRDGHGRPDAETRQEAFPFGIGPIAFDSAQFKIERTAWANQRFEEAVRAVDPETPLWSGANNLAWPIPQIPTSWGAFFDFYPSCVGEDWLTHHLWSMDIGRGPNVHPVMQMLLPEHFSTFDWHLDARVLRGWMVESAIHGASGITIWPWTFLDDDRPGDRSSSIERLDTIGITIRQLQSSGLFEMKPTPTIAILYQPYAEGWGAMSQVYGVMRYPTGEPLPLLHELRFGTHYGQVEYLTANTLAQACFDDYGVILAPFACDLTADQISLLRCYVEKGGVLVADVGFDCIRGGMTLTSMSTEAKSLFGIESLQPSTAGSGAWVAATASDLFTELHPGIEQTNALDEYLLDVTATTAVRVLAGPGTQGLYVNALGKGYAVFCSALAWAKPTAAEPLLYYLHEALFKRRAKIELLNDRSKSLLEQRAFYAQDFELALYSNGYVIQNRSDADPSLSPAEQMREFTFRVKGHERHIPLSPRSVVLVRDGEIIPLAAGQWPVEMGPAQK